jgi:CheY-like chemotaxis protein
MNATGKRVLVMDDEDVVCRSYERVLTQAGFEVDKAHNGPQALEEAGRHDYDVLLADIKMPGMDGLQVIEKLRATRPTMPVVVITGYPSQDTLHEAARLGVTDYLTKPVAPDVLTQATMQALTAQYGRTTPQPPILQMPQGPEIAPIPNKLPAGAILWPEHPVPVHATAGPAPPVARELREAVTPAVVPATEPEPDQAPEPGRLDTLGRLALAPIVSLAYVMFLPFLGIAMFFGLGTKALWGKIGGRR